MEKPVIKCPARSGQCLPGARGPVLGSVRLEPEGVMPSSHSLLEEVEEADELRPTTPDRHQCAGVLSASDRSGSPAPRDPEEGGIVIEVELVRALSGSPLAYKTFSILKDQRSALGSLIAMGEPHETDKSKVYSYIFCLEDGRTIHCEDKMYHKIFDYAGDLKAIPLDPMKHNEDDLVFRLVLQQVIREKEESEVVQ